MPAAASAIEPENRREDGRRKGWWPDGISCSSLWKCPGCNRRVAAVTSVGNWHVRSRTGAGILSERRSRARSSGDRAIASGAIGRRFESCRAYQQAPRNCERRPSIAGGRLSSPRSLANSLALRRNRGNSIGVMSVHRHLATGTPPHFERRATARRRLLKG